MIKDGKGGANTQVGLEFEKNVDITTLIAKLPNYLVKKDSNLAGDFIFYKDQLVARSLKKYDFYRFLEEEGVDYSTIISKKLLPDDALLVIIRDTLFIIEVKYQEVSGSVDEKLQTCDFKRKQYAKLVSSLELKVEYIYVLNDWFKDRAYKDVLDYINSVNCHYVFNKIPFTWLGLPLE